MKYLLIALITFYQKGISPMFPPRCRFYPSCSEYAKASIGEWGTFRGLFWTLRRFLRCHPFCEGGIDLPPVKVKGTGWKTSPGKGRFPTCPSR